MRYGVTARRKRNMRRVGELADLRRERREALRPTGAAAMIAQDTKASGALVIDAERVSKAYGERAIVSDFSLRVMRRDRIGIVGANGAGKTTLVNLLTGALAPDSGSVRLGANVAMASLDQGRASLEPATTLVDALTGGRQRLRHNQWRASPCHGLHARLPVSARAGPYADRQIVRGRTRAAHACEGAGEAVQPARSRRADQRPRHRDARSPAGTARRLCRNDPSRQPRSRFSRSRRDLGRSSATATGGGSNMRAAIPTWSPSAGYGLAGPLAAPVEAAEKPEKRPTVERAAPKRKLGFNEKRALEALPDANRKAPRRSSRRSKRSSPTPTSPFASRTLSRTRPGLTLNCATRWPAPRTSGSGSRSCARSSSGNKAA